jgi:hypothetical protein
MESMSFFTDALKNSGSFGSHSGGAPSPFDALNGPALAGFQGSHPLHQVQAAQLVRPSDGGPIGGEIVLDHPVRVGEGIDGTIKLVATQRIEARGANLRLVGLRLDEERKSREERDSKGNVVSSEQWVEANGRLFAEEAFMEPAIPAILDAGPPWEGHFSVPAPPLGPPTAHLGESIIAWALEVRWDVPHGSDHFIALYVPVAQHPDLLRAGVGKQGGYSLSDSVSIGDAAISISSALPAPSGTEIVVQVAWPAAPGGQNARIELHRRTNAPNGEEGIIASVPLSSNDFSSGQAVARLPIPAGSPPSFDGAGLEIDYVIRVLVDRRLRSDLAIERPVGIV